MLKRTLAGLGCAVVVVTTAVVASPALAAVDPPVIDIVRPVSSLIQMPTQYPVQPDLTVVADLPTDASIARGVMPYDEIAPFLNGLMDRSDRVSSQVVGTSALGREIYMVTVTAPETPAQTAQQSVWRTKVKYDSTAAANDQALQDGYKVPIWFNGNIHGNEWEGTDATLNYIEDLATSTDPEVASLLSENRIYFTVTNNPDGRALGQRATATGYDPNRDFITGATSETAVVRDLASLIQPTYFVDLHGYTNVLQVEPCGPPHGENYEYDLFVPHAYATALEIEKAVVAANIPGNTYLASDGSVTTTNTGKIKIPYRDIRAGWDDWPPIFAPQYVAYQGAVTNTVELPLGRTGDQPARAKVNIAVAEVVIDTVVDYIDNNSEALLDNQIEIFRRGVAGEKSVVIPADISAADLPAGVPAQWTEIWDETDVYNADYPRAYVIPTDASQRSTSDAETLVQQLLVHGIQVQKTTAPFSVGGTSYPAGSYYVDMHQPLRGLANVLLDEGSDISQRVPDMYDISAWSLSLLWGADVASIGSTTDAAPTTALERITTAPLQGSIPAAGTFLAFEPRGVADYQAVNELLGEGVPLAQIPDGTIILGPDEASYAAASAVARIYGVDFVANDGRALRDGESTALRSVRVGYVNSFEDRDALTKLGFTNLVPVTSATINSGAVDLSTIDLLFVGANLTFTATQTAGTAAVNAYVAAGKPVVGRGTAGAAFVNTFGITTVATTSGTSGSNGIVSVATPADGVLGDYAQDTAFVSPAVWYSGLGTNAKTEQTYLAGDPFVAGHWAASTGRAQADAAGKPSAFSAVGASGSKAFVFGTSPTYRNHPVGAFSDIARAIFWAAGEGTAVTPPGPVISEDLVEENRGTVSIPETAEPGQTITVSLGEGFEEAEVSALLFSTPIGLGDHIVADGTFDVEIPATTPLGLHRVAVVDAESVLIGWDDILIAIPEVVEETPEPTDSPEPSASPAAVAATDGLALTGSPDVARIGGLALAAILVGAGVFLIVRIRTRRETS